MGYKKILIVYKKPVLEVYSKRSKEVKLMLKEGRKLEDLEAEKYMHKKTLKLVLNTLENDREINFDKQKDMLYRADLSKDVIRKYDLIMAVGGDGTLMEVSHYCKEHEKPILGINSDYRDAADSSEGFFCGANLYDFSEKYRELQEELINEHKLTRLKVQLRKNGKKWRTLDELVINDVLIAHENPPTTGRYIIFDKGIEEFQKSSGLIVGTPASTWCTNVSLVRGGKVLQLENRKMQYVAREFSFGRLSCRQKLKTGVVTSLKVVSKMRKGKLWIDGEHVCYDFGLGLEAKITISPYTQTILGFDDSKRKYYIDPDFGSEYIAKLKNRNA